MSNSDKPDQTVASSGAALDEYALQFQQLATAEMPPCSGFSARLNMLWDIAGVAPSLTGGRVLSILAINRNWRENEVRSWLQKDVLPARVDLRNMVQFLLSHMQDRQSVECWEAFLIYGSPIVSSPINYSMYRQDRVRRQIASAIFAQVTDEYAIAPSSYDAEQAFQRCLTLMHKFNIYEHRDFQAGHLEAFRNYMFPDS